MRKDLKIGLTIGAILVVTLVVYLIVLSRGGGAGNTPPAPLAQGPGHNLPGDVLPAPDSPGLVVEHPTPLPLASAGATTEPAVATDWNNALEHGLPASLSAAAPPERTTTPLIDTVPTAALPRSGGVSRDPAAPVIDTIATTLPSPVKVADIPAAPLASPPTTAGQRTHRVAAGETPSSIAADIYGNAKYCKDILAANPGVDPRHLKIGQILVIPELTQARPSAAAEPSAAIDPAIAYKVAPGDTLEKITRKLYGSTELQEKLYQLNKTLIGPDENVLKVGWVLKLPQAPKAATAAR